MDDRQATLQVDEHTGWYRVGDHGQGEHEGYVEQEIWNTKCVIYHCGWNNDLLLSEWKKQGLSRAGWWSEMDGRCACETGVEPGKTRERLAHCTDNGAPRRGRQSRVSAGYGHGLLMEIPDQGALKMLLRGTTKRSRAWKRNYFSIVPHRKEPVYLTFSFLRSITNILFLKRFGT